MGKKERCGRASFPSRSILSPLRTQKAYVQPTAAGGKIRNTHLFVGRRKMLIVRVCEKLLHQKWEIHSFSFQVHVWFCDALSWCHEMSCRKQVLISVLVLWVCSVNDHELVQECILAFDMRGGTKYRYSSNTIIVTLQTKTSVFWLNRAALDGY